MIYAYTIGVGSASSLASQSANYAAGQSRSLGRRVVVHGVSMRQMRLSKSKYNNILSYPRRNDPEFRELKQRAAGRTRQPASDRNARSYLLYLISMINATMGRNWCCGSASSHSTALCVNDTLKELREAANGQK